MWNAEVYHSLSEVCYFQLPRWLWAFLAWTLICSTENAVERSIWIFRYCFSNGMQPSWLEGNYTWEEPLKHCRWSRRAFSDMRLPWKPWIPAMNTSHEMNTSHITFMADMLLKVSFVANRSDRTGRTPSTFLLQISQVCISGFVFCLSAHPRFSHGWKRARGRTKPLPLQSVVSRDTFEITQRPPKAPKNWGNRSCTAVVIKDSICGLTEFVWSPIKQ